MFLIHWMPEAENEYYDNLNFWINHNKSNTYSLKIISEVEKMENILSENHFIGKRTNYQLLVLKIVILRSFYIYYTVSDNTVSILAFKATKEDNNKHQLGI